jgi:hypothetical protein
MVRDSRDNGLSQGYTNAIISIIAAFDGCITDITLLNGRQAIPVSSYNNLMTAQLRQIQNYLTEDGKSPFEEWFEKDYEKREKSDK